jgi:hypothetical protein
MYLHVYSLQIKNGDKKRKKFGDVHRKQQPQMKQLRKVLARGVSRILSLYIVE